MSNTPIFDLYGSITDRRAECVERLLPELIRAHRLNTTLDVGCGVGVFANRLQRLGLTATGVDARREHVEEARRRHPDLTFHVSDVEDPQAPALGTWDVVLSFGLLYHLENPFRAVRNLFALTRTLLVIETMVAPFRVPLAGLVDEHHGEDQSLNYIALIPSESCLISMLYRAGFCAVYRPVHLPDHDQFRASWRYRQRRTVLVASRVEIVSPELTKVREHTPRDLWEKPWARRSLRALRWLARPLGMGEAGVGGLTSRS